MLQRRVLKRTVEEAKAKLNFSRNRIPSPCSSFSTAASSAPSDVAPRQLPPFHYQPKPYNGPSADEILEKRKKFLGPSLFYYYQKPVRKTKLHFFFSRFYNFLILYIRNLFIYLFFKKLCSAEYC